MSAPEILRITDADGDRIEVNVLARAPRHVLIEIVPADDSAPQAVAIPMPAVGELRDFLTKIINAPRDAARLAAEVVHRDDDLMLVKTSLGEWGVGSEAEPDTEVSWFAGEDAERGARRLYNSERDIESCCVCAAAIDENDPGVGGCEDGVLCSRCAEDSHQEWLAADVVCVGGFTVTRGDGAACGWRGKGADAAMVAGNSRHRECPTCGGDVELVEDAAGEPSP